MIDGFNELTRYIDTLNYVELFTNAEGRHSLYNLYYGNLNQEKKIIDSLDFITLFTSFVATLLNISIPILLV